MYQTVNPPSSVILNCDMTVLSHLHPLKPVQKMHATAVFVAVAKGRRIGCGPQDQGGVDRRPADHTCCDICPSHTGSSLLVHMPLSWVWMPGMNPDTGRNRKARGGLGFILSWQEKMSFLPSNTSWVPMGKH